MSSKETYPLPQRDTPSLSSKAVSYINILERTVKNKDSHSSLVRQAGICEVSPNGHVMTAMVGVDTVEKGQATQLEKGCKTKIFLFWKLLGVQMERCGWRSKGG